MNNIQSGALWPDTDGNHINAHGGGILHHEGRYYWYGECRPPGSYQQDAQIGVSCYSSTDLLNWKNEGVALSVIHDDPAHPLTAGCKIERPKVLHCPSTGKFVMWWHHDLKGWGHAGAFAGTAVADSPTGPFTFLRHSRPGGMFRDCTLFQDDDGSAWLVYATDDNCNLAFRRLSDDYTQPAGSVHRLFPGRYMEAPCVFKRGEIYYLIASDCTAWAPNEARSAYASSLTGPWKEFGNPCLGDGAEITFGGQSTFVLPVAGKNDAFIFMADIWRPEDQTDSRYIWLPIEFRKVPGYPWVDRPFIRWRDQWDPSVFDAEKTKPQPPEGR